MLRLLLSPRWLVRHVLLAAALATCWGFGQWQLERALERHSVLNWSYTVEWALFGAFAVLCWGWFLRDERRDQICGPRDETEPERPVYQRVAAPVPEDEDPELAAYNRYLAELHTKGSA